MYVSNYILLTESLVLRTLHLSSRHCVNLDFMKRLRADLPRAIVSLCVEQLVWSNRGTIILTN